MSVRHLIARSLIPVAVGLAFVVPAIASIGLSYLVAVRDQQLLAGSVASEMLYRAQAISGQIAHAKDVLEGYRTQQPCSPENISRMRELAMGASYLQAVGYVENNRLLCSSYGDHGNGIPLGEPDYLSSRGAWIRTAVALPFGPHSKVFIVTEANSGYSSLALPDLILDAGRENRDISIALVSISNRRIIFRRGELNVRDWPRFHQEDGTARWQADDSVGAVRFSAAHDYAAIASVPIPAVRASWAHAAMWIVPFGVLLGSVFSTLVFLLARQQSGMVAKLDRAMRRNELFLAYMPIVELSSGRWVGAEALLRWRRRSGELIGPDKFIPLAERHHRTKKLTTIVLERLVEDARRHMTECVDTMYISINLSAADLSDPGSVEKVCQARDRAGVPAIMVEATEGALLNIGKAGSHIRQLRERGIRVAIDDFGTGYSSLSYLSALEVDCIKIDKSFICAIGTASATDHVVRHIIEMTKDLGLGVIAEGVETREQAAYLMANGVKYAQGWLFGEPMPAHEFVKNMK